MLYDATEEDVLTKAKRTEKVVDIPVWLVENMNPVGMVMDED